MKEMKEMKGRRDDWALGVGETETENFICCSPSTSSTAEK